MATQTTFERIKTGTERRFGGYSERQKKLIVKASSVVVVALLWEVTGRALGEVLFAPLSVVIPAYIDLAIGGPMFPTLLKSFQDMFIGYGLAVAFAVPIGLVMGRSVLAEKTIEPWVSLMFVTSTSAMLPFLLTMFGIGRTTRIIIIWLACVWHILLNVYHGTKGISNEYLDVAKSFDVPDLMRYRTVVLPATIPYVMAGLRMGIARAFRGLILAETFILVGYGGLIGQYGSQSISTAPVLALILTIMFFGTFFSTGLEKLQERLLPWADANPSL